MRDGGELNDEQDETVIVVHNQRSAGRAAHWLIIPKTGPAVRHIRDVEALTMDDLPLRMPLLFLFPRSFPFSQIPHSNSTPHNAQCTTASQPVP